MTMPQDHFVLRSRGSLEMYTGNSERRDRRTFTRIRRNCGLVFTLALTLRPTGERDRTRSRSNRMRNLGDVLNTILAPLPEELREIFSHGLAYFGLLPMNVLTPLES